MYIFGGNTPYGLQNDMWKFNFDLLQWAQVDNENTIDAVYRFGFTSYEENNSTYFVIYGGKLNDKYSDDLFIYSLETQTWTKMQADGDRPPGIILSCLEYYKGAIYLACGENHDGDEESEIYHTETYVYNLTTFSWKKLELNEKYSTRSYTDSVVVGKWMYILYGYSNIDAVDLETIQRLNLENPTSWETFVLENSDNPKRDSFSACTDSSNIYLSCGYIYDTSEILNDLVKISISSKTSKSLSPVLLVPSNRLLHTMEVINGEFYLFGGSLGESVTDELWKFDPETEIWEIVMPLGTTPQARSMHDSDSQGDIMVIWGGVGDSGYLGDMHYYNVQTKTWSEVKATGSVPTARRGPCVEMILPYVIIYGGETNEGITNEVWVYNSGDNTYELYYENNPNVDATLLQKCEAELVDEHIILYTMTGAGEGEAPYLFLKYFNLTDRIWTVIYKKAEDFYKTKTVPVAKKIGNTFMIIGGETWSTDAWRNVILAQPAVAGDGGGVIVDPDLDYTFYIDGKNDFLNQFIWGSAFVYYKNFIYSHGGGGQLGGSTRTTISHSKLFKMNVTLFCELFDNNCTASCSPGTFKNSLTETCEICSKGFYAESYNNSKCKPCPSGTYNSFDGANTVRQCYPCGEGTYSNIEGASYCLDCPPGYSCPSGSQIPSLNSLVAKIVSEQPKPYRKSSKKAESAEYTLYYTFVAFLIISLFFICIFRKTFFPIIILLDLYTDSHNYDEHIPLKLKKTFLGGVFSLCFLSLAILLIIYTIIEFTYNNVDESKTLIPLVIMEDEVTEFSSDFLLNLVFLRYGGSCTDENKKCVSSITIQSVNIKGKFVQKSCYMSEEQDCSIEYTCSNCEITAGAYVNVVASEKTSYASAISLNITVGSSIPNTKSSVYILIKTPENSIFKGSDPTIFLISAIPSLYRKGITGKDHTGYHLSVNSQPIAGSYYSTDEIAFTVNLKAKISLELTDSSLYTLRHHPESEIVLVNGLLGSVFGLMSLIMVLMKFVELTFIRLEKVVEERKLRSNIAEKRKDLAEQVYRNLNEDKNGTDIGKRDSHIGNGETVNGHN